MKETCTGRFLDEFETALEGAAALPQPAASCAREAAVGTSDHSHVSESSSSSSLSSESSEMSVSSSSSSSESEHGRRMGKRSRARS